MTTQARRLEGEAAAAAVREEVKARVEALRRQHRTAGLAVVQVGNLPASDIYVRRKIEAADALGLFAQLVRIQESDGYPTLLTRIGSLNSDARIHGFLVQLPLPDGWDEAYALRSVNPEKDLDGCHPTNVGRATLGDPNAYWPCTPLGIFELLRHYHIPLAGAHAVVVGRSRLVGRPLATILSQKGVDATVTLCHSRSGDLARYTRDADVVVMAAGQPGALTGDMIREGAVVVDVGVHRVPDPDHPGKTRLIGDVDEASVAPKAAWLSPVPGGVGPMTVVMLMRNAVTACERTLGSVPAAERGPA
ncbi:MAG TPA: bifunctional 5,10-methylenetetrahydrofolate dehydrogenase/5,10-methenyltetrahydrofolate cyclohydrolase [Candidatus Saccharimonadales bacterium]|nr:bifunctional 5,10-methylenetetrahydrofolate dehydrogenase/5,10-methenyltetrahydrofolate cyclohydrolase [Candidatus Saccharimonadales bacterium]